MLTMNWMHKAGQAAVVASHASHLTDGFTVKKIYYISVLALHVHFGWWWACASESQELWGSSVCFLINDLTVSFNKLYGLKTQSSCNAWATILQPWGWGFNPHSVHMSNFPWPRHRTELLQVVKQTLFMTAAVIRGWMGEWYTYINDVISNKTLFRQKRLASVAAPTTASVNWDHMRFFY